MQKDLKKIGSIIKEARLKKRWSMYRLELMSGVQRGHINSIENGRDSQTTSLIKLSRALKITLKIK